MKTFGLLLGLIMICALAGCEKHNILDIRTTYCTVLINGEEYKDAPTLREQLGRNGYAYFIPECVIGETSIQEAFIMDLETKEIYLLNEYFGVGPEIEYKPVVK